MVFQWFLAPGGRWCSHELSPPPLLLRFCANTFRDVEADADHARAMHL